MWWIWQKNGRFDEISPRVSKTFDFYFNAKELPLGALTKVDSSRNLPPNEILRDEPKRRTAYVEGYGFAEMVDLAKFIQVFGQHSTIQCK